MPFRQERLFTYLCVLAAIVGGFAVLCAPLPPSAGAGFALVGDLNYVPEHLLIPYPPAATARVALTVILMWLNGWLLWLLFLDFTRVGHVVAGRRGLTTGVAFAAILLGGIHAEAVVRTYVAAHHLPNRPDARTMWMPQPIGPTDNRFGLRCRDYPRGKVLGTTRFLVVGDSATFGTNVEPQQVYEALLEQRCGTPDSGVGPAEFINAGIKGASTLTGLNLARRLVPFYHPDVLMVAFNNDSFPAELEDRQRIASSEAVLAVQDVLYRSELYLLLRREVINACRGRAPRPTRPDILPSRPRVSLEDFRANLEGFANVAHRYGARLVLLILPTPHAMGYDEAVCDVAARRGALAVDLNVIWKGDLRLRRLLVPDIYHPTPAGHRLIADVLFERLRSAGILSTAPHFR